MNSTKHDLPAPVRKRIAAILNARLADAIDLQLQAKQAHWNVKGPQFIALHELFDQVASGAVASVDLIAERAVQLGSTAEGTVQIVAQRSSLKPYPTEISEGRAHVTALANALAEVAAMTRAAIDECGQIGDQTSADVFTEISRTVDKHLWFVEAHLAGSPERGLEPMSESHE
jgi:starvation-inducible DNA-binding protein